MGRWLSLSRVFDAVLLTTSLVVIPGLAAPESAADPRPAITEAPDEASALVAARSSGQRVEVMGERTARSQVFANPSGTLTMEQHNQAVRVRRGDGWVPVDATLRVRDGWVVPAAAEMDVRFSTGGDGPVMVLSKGDKRLALSWPGRLPQPIVVSDRATYPEVLPGVDLQALAQPTSARLLVVVKNREAARNPALRRIAYRLSSEGLTMRTDASSGAMTVVDTSGEIVFRGGTPLMWDSADIAPTVTEGQSERPRRQSTVRTEVGAAELALIPDERLFADPAAVYPVVVDPSLTTPWVGWTHIDSGFPRENYLNDPNRPDIPVGAYVHTNGNTHLSISYFGFGTIPLGGKEIISATFKAYQIHNAPFSCTWTGVQLLMTGWFDQSTSWNNPPQFRGLVSETSSPYKAGNGTCPANWVEFPAKSAVQAAASGHWEGLALAMQAPNWDTVNRKRFDKSAALVVEYNSPPNAPSSLYADINLPCSTGTGLPATNTSPTLFATGLDADGGNIEMLFEWGVADSGQLSGSYRHPFQPSGTRFSAVIPTSGLQNGVTYSWHAVAGDGRVWGPGSAWCSFTYDTTRPTGVPGVTSTSFPENDLGAAVGVRGEFTFTSTDLDVYGYRYGLTENTTYFVVAGAGPDRSATVPVTMWTTAPQFMFVYSIDRAGNRSTSPRSYRFIPDESSSLPPRTPGDVNGDGLADLLGVQQRDADETAFLSWMSKGPSVYEPARTWDSGPNTAFTTDRTKTATGDFNGDGRADAAVLRAEGDSGLALWVFRGNGMGYDVPASPTWGGGGNGWFLSSVRSLAGDVNGDGKTDLVAFYYYPNFETGVWIFYGTASGLAAPVFVWDSGVGQWDGARSKEVAGDFNGDGKADLGAYYDLGSGRTKLLYLYGTATGVAAPVMVWDSGASGWWFGSIYPVSGDFNGDGKADIGAFYDYGGAHTRLWMFYGAPTGITGGMAWDSGVGNWWAGSSKSAGRDLNGDGRADIAAFYNSGDGQTKLWVFEGHATNGVGPPAMRWDSGAWGLDWTRTNFY